MQEEARLKRDVAEMLGTTKRGIGPTYASKVLRFGLRVGDLADWSTFLEKYERFINHCKHQFHITEFDQ